MKNSAEILAERVEQRLKELGLTGYAASMTAIGKPDLVRDIQRGRMPSAPRLSALARALQTTPEWLLDETNQLRASAPAAHVAASARAYQPQSLPKNLPVVGSALGSTLDFDDGNVPVESHLVEMGDVVEYILRPAGLSLVKDAYALYISGDSQSPRFEHGELVIVNPRRPARAGDDVVVQLRDEEGGQVVTALIKRLRRQSPRELELQQFNPPRTIVVPMAKVAAIHRITPTGELLAF